MLPLCLQSFVALAAVMTPVAAFAQYFAPLPVAQVRQTPPQANYSLAAACGCNGQAAGTYPAPAASSGSLPHASSALAPNVGLPNAYGAETSGFPGGADASAMQTFAPYGAGNGYGASNECTTPYGGANYSDGGSSCGNGYGTGYPGLFPRNNPRGLWYASAAGLYLQRSEPRRIWTSYENNNNPNQLMNTQNIETGGAGGVDLRLGRYFACNRWALELGYWSVKNFDGSASQTHANGVSSPLLFNDLEFAVGDPVEGYFNNAMEHRLRRTNELHNLELNVIEGNRSSRGCSPWSRQMLFGIRYFKFDEDLVFATLDQGGTWGGNGGLDEVRLSDSISNDLLGAQVGCLFQRQIGSRASFFITPKFGIYNNHIQNRFDLRRGDGTAAMPSSFSGVNGSYPVEASTNVVSFLSEANIGLQYQLSNRWTLLGGYRVVAITGVGLADNQIPQYLVDIPEIADINTDGSLVLHGAFFGVSYSL